MTKHYKVYVVGTHDCQSTWVGSVFTSKRRALVRWNEYRNELIRDTQQEFLGLFEAKLPNVIQAKCLRNLSNTDPKTMDNFPYEQPYIKEMIVE